MTTMRFHSRSAGKRRGDGLPARLRFSARRGVTLVELLVAMLILTIVSIAWLEIIGIQSARREARRREAVERLSGMMDAFMYVNRNANMSNLPVGGYRMQMNLLASKLEFLPCETNQVHAVFASDVSPVGYQICVIEKKDVPDAYLFSGWVSSDRDHYNPRWLVGRLYDRNGMVSDAGRPFFSLLVCLGL